ncbi:MAG: peptidylprolyl isomerase [Candidatus Omnitrophica bacterium]|nr:peptidylprolyl isomerase [Candidatus Omnitrophota bacterium]
MIRLTIAAAVVLMANVPSVMAETVNRIVAVVNDAVITEADVMSQMHAMLEDPEVRLPDDADPAEVHRVILRRLIEQQIILQEAKRGGVVVASDEVAARMDHFRQRFGSEEAFQQALADSGLSEEQLKQSVRDQLLVQRVIDANVRSTISVSPQEVARELDAHPELAKPGDRVRASHLLVRVDERRGEAEARALIEDLRRQLAGGADFAELATRHSEDSHREAGGDMGWVAQGELLPELDAVLFSLPVGQLSDPIQTRLGFHLVNMEERRSAASLSVTDANHAIQQQLYQRKYQAALIRWLTDLKRRAYIEIVPSS